MASGRILVTGGSGFLGSLLSLKARDEGYEVWAASHSQEISPNEGINPVKLDLRDRDDIALLVRRAAPQVVIHTAYSPIDRRVTFDGTVSLSWECRKLPQTPFFIFLSTDLVFDGLKGMYTENDQPRPVLDYGRDKLDAERSVREVFPGALIMRTSLIYDLERVPSHLRFAVDAIRNGQGCTFFEDEFRSPVLADDLAEVILKLADIKPSGIFHVAGADRVDRFSFGVGLLRVLGFDVSSVGKGSAKAMGKVRPPDCSLDSSRAEKLTGMHFLGVKEVFGLP
jgi:dTDP-4-dehydrorhamnose reductase